MDLNSSALLTCTVHAVDESFWTQAMSWASFWIGNKNKAVSLAKGRFPLHSSSQLSQNPYQSWCLYLQVLWWSTTKSWLPSPFHTSFMCQKMPSLEHFEAPRGLMCSDWNNLPVWWPKMAQTATHPLGFSELWGAWKLVYIEPSAVKAFSLLNMWMNWAKKIRSVFFPMIVAFAMWIFG